MHQCLREKPTRRRSERGREPASGLRGPDDPAGENAGERRSVVVRRVRVDVHVEQIRRRVAEEELPQRRKRQRSGGQEHEGQLPGPSGRLPPFSNPNRKVSGFLRPVNEGRKLVKRLPSPGRRR
ncbi:unnamed protein product [Cuscuta epithymum]|uniref:Uncharacterized protein n=1 Tax=Cuscuta epithymum TaxID=186058 RepID=A0AAV0CS53_9ASTE|nr:unnamed protein product [Cuscuta epithymum]